jgi:hypothetical protein
MLHFFIFVLTSYLSYVALKIAENTDKVSARKDNLSTHSAIRISIFFNLRAKPHIVATSFHQ